MLQYQFKKNGVAIDGATDPTMSLSDITEDDNGRYTLDVTESVTGKKRTYGPLVIDGVSGGSIVVLSPPDGFDWTPPFSITKTGTTYATDYDPADTIPSTAVTYYVDPINGADTNAGTEIAPWKSLYKAIHNRAQNALVYAKPGIYRYSAGLAATAALGGTAGATPYNLALRRWGDSGVIRTIADATVGTWTLESGTVWKATVSGGTGYRVVDFANLTSQGNGQRLSTQTSVVNCQANPGSYYFASGTVYVCTADEREPDEDIEVFVANSVGLYWTGRGTYWMEHVESWGGSYPFWANNSSGTCNVYATNCKYHYGAQSAGGAQISGGLETIWHQCESSQNENDGFKYVASGGFITKYAELACSGYDNGQTATNAANTSSAHDGGIGVRINCIGANSRGRPFHDITGAQSWLLGCSSGPSMEVTSEGARAAFGCGTGESDASVMWLDGCTSLSPETDCEAATLSEIFIRNLARTANADIGTITAY